MTYTVTHSARKPVTFFYGSDGVLPLRTLAYREITPIKGFNPDKFGVVTFNKKRVIVAFVGGQWESIAPVLPVGTSLVWEPEPARA